MSPVLGNGAGEIGFGFGDLLERSKPFVGEVKRCIPRLSSEKDFELKVVQRGVNLVEVEVGIT